MSSSPAVVTFGHKSTMVVTLAVSHSLWRHIHSGILNSTTTFNAAEPPYQLLQVSNKAPSGASTNCPVVTVVTLVWGGGPGGGG